jgi:WD40 repeat protein
MIHSFDAYVAAALFVATRETGETPVFALGDGTVRYDGQDPLTAHDGAVLCAAAHPSGEGVVTGGDDGRLVWSTPSAVRVLADLSGRWIDAVAVSPASGLIAFASGKEVTVLDWRDSAFRRVFRHERSLAALAFDPKGRRLAAATYGGALLWYARIADQKPHMLRYAGAHVAIAYSPDGRFIVTGMQENAVHGWRLADGVDLRMGGYPAKPKSLAFFAKGALLATSGAQGMVVWPFSGSSGPMGKEAAEIGADGRRLVTVLAAAPLTVRIAAGRDDGSVWTADLNRQDVPETTVREPGGGAITALALSSDEKRLAFGAEDGEAGVLEI